MSDFDNKNPNQQYSVYLTSDDWIRSRENSLGVIQVSKWMLKDDGFLEACMQNGLNKWVYKFLMQMFEAMNAAA
jgi:hypothetical protein